MTLNMWKRDMADDAGILTGDVRQFTSDVRHLATDAIKDAKAEVAHLADPAQREWLVERHFGFLIGVIGMFLVVYLGVIAVILSSRGTGGATQHATLSRPTNARLCN